MYRDYGLLLLVALRRDLHEGLLNHIEHAKTWPGGWVEWRTPLAYRTQLLLTVGFLTAGDSAPNAIAVHINEEGRQFLEDMQ